MRAVRSARRERMQKRRRLLSFISREEIKCSPIKIGWCDAMRWVGSSRGHRPQSNFNYSDVCTSQEFSRFFYDLYHLIKHDARHLLFFFFPFSSWQKQEYHKDIRPLRTWRFVNDSRMNKNCIIDNAFKIVISHLFSFKLLSRNTTPYDRFMTIYFSILTFSQSENSFIALKCCREYRRFFWNSDVV